MLTEPRTSSFPRVPDIPFRARSSRNKGSEEARQRQFEKRDAREAFVTTHTAHIAQALLERLKSASEAASMPPFYQTKRPTPFSRSSLPPDPDELMKLDQRLRRRG